MGRSVSIQVTVQAFKTRTREVIEALLNSGWTYDDNGSISYLPLGDGDDFEWRREAPNEWPKIARTIQEKDELDELIGLSLVSHDMGAGGEFLFDARKGSIMMSPSVNRRRIPTLPDITDYTWYLERLLPALFVAGLVVEHIECCEHA